MLQNDSSVKLFTLCIHECLMNIYTKFYPRTVSQSWDMDPSLWTLKSTLQVIKSFNRDNINNSLFMPLKGTKLLNYTFLARFK